MNRIVLATLFVAFCLTKPAAAADFDDVLSDIFNGDGDPVAMGTVADPNVPSKHNSGNDDESDQIALPDGWVVGADGSVYVDGHLELARPADADATHYDENGIWQPSPWYQAADGVVRYDDGSRPGDTSQDLACIGSGNGDCNSDAGFYIEGYTDTGEPVYGNNKQ